MGCNRWGRWELDMTQWLHFHFSLSCIEEGNGNPLQCSCLENPRDGGAWWDAVYGVAQSRARLKQLSSSSSTYYQPEVMLKILQARLQHFMNFQMFKLDLEKVEEPDIKLPTSIGSSKKRVPEKHLFLLYWLSQSLGLCGSQQTVENSSRDGNTRLLYLPPEKSVCRSRSNS